LKTRETRRALDSFLQVLYNQRRQLKCVKDDEREEYVIPALVNRKQRYFITLPAGREEGHRLRALVQMSATESRPGVERLKR
jgi:hypothetical protein